MNQRVKAIVEEARKLSSDERADLVERLQQEFAADISDGTPEEIEAAWAAEVERRIAAAERGETVSIPAEEVMAELRARLAKL
ncbi:MAG: addiction module protein [Hyphomicrobiaceae bacterium]|nr:addiction module protein [Hyphomicrobiaceae bacterium]